MAENTKINGGGVGEMEDPATENFEDASESETVKISELSRKIQTLEKEKVELSQEKKEIQEKVDKLTEEIEVWKKEEVVVKERIAEMEREVENSEENKRALEAAVKKCAELETEVARLQHELLTSMNEADEVNAEIMELRQVLGEKVAKVESLQAEIEALKKSKSESEKRVRDLERKIGVLEMKEMEGKSKRLRVEEEMRDKIAEKDGEIMGLKKKVEDLETAIRKNAQDSENWVKEKQFMEEKIIEYEEKARNLEEKMMELQKEAEKVLMELKESEADGTNGDYSRDIADEKETNLQWPVLAAGSTGAIVAAAALVYVCYGRRT